MQLHGQSSRVRMLAYPGGKLFAFTIVDDTDGQTLEITRTVYDELAALGLRTTKTVWVSPPSTPPVKPGDHGATLADPEYAEYHKRLQNIGFEIALHNVSSQSNTRAAIADGLERFRALFGAYPKMNIHHEKNRENLYFEAANRVDRLPPVFRSPLFRGVWALRRRLAPPAVPASAAIAQCSGEKTESDYFWGDLCKEKVQYVRTNVFLNDLNTVKLCPTMPLRFADTPYVNNWFYSSEGQDAAHFNRILSERNVRRLREEHGASILYTHFGKGFVGVNNGRPVLNAETKARLRYIAAQEHGWFAPAGEILDRLLAFQRVFSAEFGGGFAIRNENDFSLRDVTVLSRPLAVFYSPEGEPSTADALGRFMIPEIGPGQTLIFLRRDISPGMKHWLAASGAGWAADLKEIARRLGDRAARAFGRHKRSPKLLWLEHGK